MLINLFKLLLNYKQLKFISDSFIFIILCHFVSFYLKKNLNCLYLNK